MRSRRCQRRAAARALGGVALALGLALAGCAPHQDEPAAGGARDAGPVDRPPDLPGSCHYDCFGYEVCDGGTLLAFGGGPVPCDEWTGACPFYPTWSKECAAGCVPDDPCVGPVCEEDRPHHAGEPCAGDADCQPPASLDWKLACNDGGVCTSVRAASDVGTPCNLPSPHHYEIRRSDLCTAQLCLVESDLSAPGRAYCTIPCQYDWECPEGYGCFTAPTYDPDGLNVEEVCWTSPPAIVLSPTCE